MRSVPHRSVVLVFSFALVLLTIRSVKAQHSTYTYCWIVAGRSVYLSSVFSNTKLPTAKPPSAAIVYMGEGDGLFPYVNDFIDHVDRIKPASENFRRVGFDGSVRPECAHRMTKESAIDSRNSHIARIATGDYRAISTDYVLPEAPPTSTRAAPRSGPGATIIVRESSVDVNKPPVARPNTTATRPPSTPGLSTRPEAIRARKRAIGVFVCRNKSSNPNAQCAKEY